MSTSRATLPNPLLLNNQTFMDHIKFVYNTSQSELAMPEYGRNIQELIYYCKNIEDPVYRQQFAEEVVNLMHIITPYNKTLEEHRKKLWHHFFRIVSYDIDVMPPNGIKPTPEEDRLNPHKVEYPSGTDKYRHYGNYVNELIRMASAMEPGPKRDAFAVIIGSYMKMAYKNWNREHYVSDDMIKNDLLKMSNGQLAIDEGVQFATVEDSPHQSQRRVFKSNYKQNYNKGRKGNFKYRNNNSNNRRRPN
jgi:hypothetical protein